MLVLKGRPVLHTQSSAATVVILQKNERRAQTQGKAHWHVTQILPRHYSDAQLDVFIVESVLLVNPFSKFKMMLNSTAWSIYISAFY